MNDHRLLSAVLPAFLLFALSPIARADVFPPLSRDLAQRLIAEYENAPVRDITIAIMLEGGDGKSGFTAYKAAQVTYISKRIEEGGKARRRVAEKIFHHNGEYGWFFHEKVCGSFGDSIELWTEKAGNIQWN